MHLQVHVWLQVYLSSHQGRFEHTPGARCSLNKKLLRDWLDAKAPHTHPCFAAWGCL